MFYTRITDECKVEKRTEADDTGDERMSDELTRQSGRFDEILDVIEKARSRIESGKRGAYSNVLECRKASLNFMRRFFIRR